MAINPKIALVHIGLMKTASTTMQNLWLKAPDVCLVHGGLLQIVQKARVTGRNPQSGASVPLQWKFDAKPEALQKIVFSQEALSTAYINERAAKGDIKQFQKTAAKLLNMVAPGAKVLITVRQPESWIQSIYNQAVKMGGIDTFPQFLTLEKNFIKQSLNIVDLLQFWGHHFGMDNILVLPVELMRTDRPVFFQKIADFTGVPAPDTAIEIDANPSMKPEHLKLMRRFNEWVNLFSQHGIYRAGLPQQVTQALNIIRFAVRFSLESPSSELEARVADTENGLPDCNIDPAHLDEGLIRRIKSHYQSVLKGNDFYGCRHLYCDG